MNRNDIIGKKFNQLTFAKFLRRDPRGHLIYKFNCDCGGFYTGRKSCVLSGNVKSCGCRHIAKARIQGLASRTHGLSRSRFQHSYYGIQKRCYSTKSPKYPRYGERGIICEWKSFNDFKSDMYESYLDHIKKFGEKNTLIERIDNDGNYSKSNCRWATTKEQSRNTSKTRFITINNKTQCLTDWIIEYGLNRDTIESRLYIGGWDPVRAIITPIAKHKI